jgi:hypothetical protein
MLIGRPPHNCYRTAFIGSKRRYASAVAKLVRFDSGPKHPELHLSALNAARASAHVRVSNAGGIAIGEQKVLAAGLKHDFAVRAVAGAIDPYKDGVSTCMPGAVPPLSNDYSGDPVSGRRARCVYDGASQDEIARGSLEAYALFLRLDEHPCAHATNRIDAVHGRARAEEAKQHECWNC